MINDKFVFEYVFLVLVADIMALLLLNMAMLVKRLRQRRRGKSASKAEPDQAQTLPPLINSVPITPNLAATPLITPNSSSKQYQRLITRPVNFILLSLKRLSFAWHKLKSSLSIIKTRLLRASALQPLKPVYRKLRIGLDFIWRWKLLPLNLILLLFAIFLINDLFIKPLNVNYYTPAMRSTWLDQEEAFVIQFDRPFNPKKIAHTIHPDIKGKWQYEDKGIPPFKRRLLFVPAESILPNSEIQIYIAQIENYLQQKPNWDKAIDLSSPTLPKISSTYPQADALDFGLEEEVILYLDQPDGQFVDWQVTINPEVEFEMKRETDPNLPAAKRQQIRLQFTKPLSQNATYELSISKSPQAYNLKTKEILIKEETIPELTFKFSTIKAAAVSKIEPNGESVLANSNITIEFDYPMVEQPVLEALKIEPPIEADFAWLEAKTLVIDPKTDLAKDTSFSLYLPAGLKNKKGGVSESEIKHTFRTIGPVQVNGFSPGNNTSNRSVSSSVSVTFNQEVDKASAQSKFSLTPQVAGQFNWEGNRLIFKPNSALAYQTTYTVNVSAGVKTIHGLDSTQAYSSKFTTEAQVFSLNIPYTRQPYRYACNLTAAKMVLDYRGVNRSINQIYAAIGTDTTPWDPGSRSWGNPNSRFVGSLDGSGSGPAGTGGYGVHWGPIRNYIASQGRGAEIKTGWNTTDLLKEVRDGNPVIIWAHNGYAGSGANISWNSSGGNIYAVKGMHSYVVRGYIGTPENPKQIMFADPGRGLWTVSISYFNSLWGTFGRTAIVVR